MSVFSIGEIRKGIAFLPASNRRAALEDWLDNEIMPWLGDRALPVTLSIAERWRPIRTVEGEGQAAPLSLTPCLPQLHSSMTWFW